jgi:outer membrane protein assembly factor BamB
VLIYNKELSTPMGKPAIVINYLKPDTIKYLPVSPVPDFSINKAYTNIRVVAELSDSASIFSGPCLVNDTILVYGNSLGLLKAISTKLCRIIWQKQLNGPVYSTPVTTEAIIVLGTVDGKIIGLDALTGMQLWEVKTGKPVLSEGIAGNGFVYIGGGDRVFYCIEAKTGKVIWQYSDIHGLIQGKPSLCGSRIFFGAWDTYLYCLDKNTGTLNWKWNNGKSQKLFSPGNITPVCSGDKVFIVAPDRYMTAIGITTGRVIWRTNKHQVRESTGVSPDGSMVYAKLMNDSVIAVSASSDSPRTLWAVNAGFGYEHNPCPLLATKELVIAATRNGLLVAIDPETRNILWKYKAGNSSINKVLVDKNQSYWFTSLEGKIMGITSIKE